MMIKERNFPPCCQHGRCSFNKNYKHLVCSTVSVSDSSSTFVRPLCKPVLTSLIGLWATFLKPCVYKERPNYFSIKLNTIRLLIAAPCWPLERMQVKITLSTNYVLSLVPISSCHLVLTHLLRVGLLRPQAFRLVY